MATLALSYSASQGLFSLSSALSFLAAMIEIKKQRRALARLDSVSLADIGLTKSQVETESKRYFWDI